MPSGLTISQILRAAAAGIGLPAIAVALYAAAREQLWIPVAVFAVTALVFTATQYLLTKRKARENQEHGRWKAIIANELVDAIITLDAQFNISEWNRGAEKLYGWAAAEVLGQPAEMVFRSNFEAAVREEVRALMKAGKPWTGEVRQLRKDGGSLWVSCSATPLRGPGGKITGLVAVNREISDRKLIEEALRTSEAKLRTIFLTMSEGIALNEMIFDDSGIMIDYRIVDVNPAFYHTADFSGRQVIGSTATQVYGMSKETIRAFWETHRKANTIVQTEYLSPLHNRTFLVSTSPFIENRFVTSFFDITDRKRAEDALRESEGRFRILVESLNEIIFTLDADGRHTGVYGPWVKRAGFTPGHFVGKTTTEILGADAARVHESANRRALKGEYVVYEWSEQSPTGPRFYQTSLSPIHRGENIVGLVGVGRDVTEHRRLEESIERNARLESIGVLAGGIAHDFNNLLAGIYGHLQMAELISENEKLSGILHRAGQTIGRARKLTGQLLTFARGGTPEMRTGELFPFATEAINFALAGSSMRCAVSVPNTLWPASFDPAQFSQVVENIALNARQASSEGGLLEVTAANAIVTENEVPGLVPGRYVKITMRDHGSGMTEEVREHVFDPFFTTKTSGSGLGMATAFSIMKRHGGAIGLDTYPGWGSAFHLYLQAGAEQPDDTSASAGVVDPGKELGAILIMDDEADVRETLEELLKFLGYEPVSTPDGTKAVEAFREAAAHGRPFSAVLLDLTIPGGVGGMEVAAAIHAEDGEVPIYVISGYARDAMPQDLRRHGISDTLQKPFRLQDLKTMLQKHGRDIPKNR